MKTTKVTEMCPHCQNEVTVQWDVEKDGYELYCPYCGFPIMLCSMCDARDGKVCDWEEIKGCKYSDERYRDYFYKNLSCENVEEIAISSRDNDGWIPVKEYGLPKANEHEFRFWVTIQYENGFRRTIKATWSYYDQCFLFQNGKKILHDIVAYRYYSAPEPYRPERSE